MSFYEHTLAGVDIDALAGFNIHHLEGSESLDLHNAVGCQTLLDEVEHRQDELLSLFSLQPVLLYQNSGNLLYGNLLHHSVPPFFTCSFHLGLILKPNTNFGGTSIR